MAKRKKKIWINNRLIRKKSEITDAQIKKLEAAFSKSQEVENENLQNDKSNLLDAQVSVICDKNGTEIKDGDIIYNEWDRDPYQQVKVIDGKFMFGKQGTYLQLTGLRK